MALHRPTETNPCFSGKQLPGKSINNPLHRLVESYNDATKKRVGENRYYAKAWDAILTSPRVANS